MKWLKKLFRQVKRLTQELFSEVYFGECETHDCEHCPFPPCDKDKKK